MRNVCKCEGHCTCEIRKLTLIDYSKVDFSQFDDIDIFKENNIKDNDKKLVNK